MFFWTNVMAWDIYKTFGQRTILSHIRPTGKDILKSKFIERQPKMNIKMVLTLNHNARSPLSTVPRLWFWGSSPHHSLMCCSWREQLHQGLLNAVWSVFVISTEKWKPFWELGPWFTFCWFLIRKCLLAPPGGVAIRTYWHPLGGVNKNLLAPPQIIF